LYLLRKLLFLFFLLTPWWSFSQVNSLTGLVRDSVTREALPYVTIIVNDNITEGTSSDSTGHFAIQSARPISSLTFSYIGYKKHKTIVSKTDAHRELTVLLAPQESELENVTIFAGENPANRIIRQAVKNRDINNYANLHSYKYTAYEKFVISGIPPEEATNDSIKLKFYEFLNDHYLAILEAVIERKHLEPDLTKETVIAQKVSGLQNPNFTVLTSEFQTTNFYEPFINIATTDFVNPISSNSWEKYFFNITDTIYSGNDTVFVLTYVPGKGKHFASLKGVIEINTDGYAIQRVVAEPSDTSLASMFVKVEQLYAKVDSIHWFPTHLNTDIGFKKFVFQGLRMYMSGRTFINPPLINPPLSKKDFDGVGIDMMDDAARKTDEFWEQNRIDTLTEREKNSYAVLDSVGKEQHFDRKLRFLAATQDGNLKLKYVSIQVYNVIKVNKPEGLRLGLGLETNSDVSLKYKVGAFCNYGLRDEVWKYGGFFEWKLYAPKNIKLRFDYSRTYEENGGNHFYQGSYWGMNENYRNYTITNFNFVDRRQISFTSRIRKFVNLEITAFDALKTPTDNYQFLNTSLEEPQLMDAFNFTGFKAALRFSYKERVIESLDRYYWINMGYPTLWLQVTQGIDGLLNGQFTYTKYEMRFTHSFPTKSFGITKLAMEGGYVNHLIPATDLFAGKSSYTFIGLYAANSFQTMRSNEFMSDKYVSLFIQQDLLTNVIRKGKFQPNFVLVTALGWGTLSHPEVHVNANVKTMERGYFESGILINNIISKKFVGIARFGIGGGVFYRYGPYAFPDPLDNISIKGTWTYNLK
jgi:hypothetical protein